MNFSAILKTIDKDLSHVGSWIQDGLKIAAPIIGAVDPPLGAIITEVENVLGSVSSSVGFTAAQVQQIVTAIATLESIKSVAPATTSTTTATTSTSPAPAS